MKNVLIALFVLYVVLYIIPLPFRPVIVPDEARYAEIPREMMETGNWVAPRLDGIRYFEKPVLGYWLTAASMSVLGQNAFAFRLPSALSMGLMLLLIFMLARRFGGGTGTAAMACAIFFTIVECIAVGTFNVLDALFSMLVTAFLVLFYMAYRETDVKKRAGWLALFGMAVGLAFMAKGFLAFALPAIAIGPFLLWERRWKDLFTMPWIPIIVALLVTVPWAIAVHIQESDYWNYFFFVEHWNRFLHPQPQAQHQEPFYYFIPVLIGGALPWTAAIPAAVTGLRQSNPEQKSLIRFCICWFVMFFLFFSASGGKLATYIMPCFPAMAILMAIGLREYFMKGWSRMFSAGAWMLVLLITAGIGFLVLSQTFRLFGDDLVLVGSHEGLLFSLAIAALAIWAGVTAWAAVSADWQKKFVLFALAPMVFFFSANFIIPDKQAEEIAPERFLTRNAPRVTKDTVLIADPSMVHATCWYYKRSDVYFFGSKGECEYGIDKYPDSTNRLVTADALKTFIDARKGKQPVVLIARIRDYNDEKEKIPAPSFKDSADGFIFFQY